MNATSPISALEACCRATHTPFENFTRDFQLRARRPDARLFSNKGFSVGAILGSLGFLLSGKCGGWSRHVRVISTIMGGASLLAFYLNQRKLPSNPIDYILVLVKVQISKLPELLVLDHGQSDFTLGNNQMALQVSEQGKFKSIQWRFSDIQRKMRVFKLVSLAEAPAKWRLLVPNLYITDGLTEINKNVFNHRMIQVEKDSSAESPSGWTALKFIPSSDLGRRVTPSQMLMNVVQTLCNQTGASLVEAGLE